MIPLGVFASDILKMDIEQAEFPAMVSLLEAFPEELPVGQLLVEVHLVRPLHLHLDSPDKDLKTAKFYLDWYVLDGQLTHAYPCQKMAVSNTPLAPGSRSSRQEACGRCGRSRTSLP